MTQCLNNKSSRDQREGKNPKNTINVSELKSMQIKRVH